MQNNELIVQTPFVYRFCDIASGALIASLTLLLGWGFGINGLPWALWSVRSMGWALAALLLGKWIVCRFTGYAPERHVGPGSRWPVIALATFNFLILTWVLISWLNPRADASFSHNLWNYGITVFHYQDNYIPWLPHTYDLTSTRSSFWTYTALAGAFWAARDWFRGYSRNERHRKVAFASQKLPDRITLWLWILIISTLIMGVSGILQKLDGTKALLWILPWGKPTPPEMPFGPYMYRANAAQYFNLIWPIALGFWWQLRSSTIAENPHAPLGGDPSIVLLPITAVLAACPAATLSRGGTLISLLLIFASSAVGFSIAPKFRRRSSLIAIAAICLITAAITSIVDGRGLIERFQRNDYSTLNGRTKIYETAHRMWGEFQWLGSGPETVPAIYNLFRETAADTDAGEAYLHNDWLETLVTFGTLGTIPIFAALVTIPTIWWCGRGVSTTSLFSIQLILALIGMLIHSTFDFPFQITALTGTWILLAALLTVLAPPKRQL